MITRPQAAAAADTEQSCIIIQAKTEMSRSTRGSNSGGSPACRDRLIMRIDAEEGKQEARMKAAAIPRVYTNAVAMPKPNASNPRKTRQQ